MAQKELKIYIEIAMWAFMLCAMVTFGITESVLVLQGQKNETDSIARLVQVNTILDTMMMDQVHNAFFESTLHFSEENKETALLPDCKT